MTISSSRHVRFADTCSVKTFEPEKNSRSVKNGPEVSHSAIDCKTSSSEDYLIKRTHSILRRKLVRLNNFSTHLERFVWIWKERRITRKNALQLLKRLTILQGRILRHSRFLQESYKSPAAPHLMGPLQKVLDIYDLSLKHLTQFKEIVLIPSKDQLPLSLR